MSQLPLIPPPMIPENVESDIPCRKCAYNLRGLSMAGRCPECGTPVAVSINGELLRYSDPTYIETLARGVRQMLWGILAVVIVSFIGGLLGGSGIGGRNSSGVQIVGLLANLPYVIGSWLLTTPDPSGIGENQYGTSRKIIRIAAVIGLSNHVITLCMNLSGPMPPTVNILLLGVVMIVSLIGLIGFIAQLIYLKTLSLRIPDLGLSKRANTVMWGIGISYGLMILIGFAMVILFRTGLKSGPGASFAAVGCVGGIIVIVVLVFAVIYLFMLGSFARSFREQATLARAMWTPPDPTTRVD